MLSFLLACTGDSVIATGRDSSEPPGDSTELAPGTDTGDEGGQDRDEHGCVDLYHQDYFPAYELTIDGAEWAALEADYQSGLKDYHPAELTLEGETVPVQVRLKGNPGFSWFGEKLQLVISFNEDDQEARFHGQRKIVLDATWYEPTLLRERLGWWVMRERGELPASCANNATLSVNGEFYGTYAHIEYLDREYLERVFGDENATGTLWKYGSEAKTNVENADYAALETFWRANDVATMETLGNVQEWTREWAAESVMGDDDGYWCCAHNFYLYDHPVEGMLFVPWDWDDTFEITPYDSDPVTGYTSALFQQEHFVKVTADPAWRAVYVNEVEAMNTAMDPEVTLPLLWAWDTEIRSSIEADPHRTFDMAEHDATVEALAAWLQSRHDYVDSWVRCERDPTADADGDGVLACDDRNDNVPVAAESCNGVDDDNDGWVDGDASCDDCVAHGIDEYDLLFCRYPRTWDEAQANCEDRGGSLLYPSATEEVYLTFFYTWPVFEDWWLGDDYGSTCLTWMSGEFDYGTAPCAESHPSVCRL